MCSVLHRKLKDAIILLFSKLRHRSQTSERQFQSLRTCSSERGFAEVINLRAGQGLNIACCDVHLENGQSLEPQVLFH